MKLRAGKMMIPVTALESDGRIYFKFGFNKKLMEEIKAMDGALWHGFADGKPVPPALGTKKVWSIKKSQRNKFQLAYLRGEDPYKAYDKQFIEVTSKRPLYKHQFDLKAHALTVHYGVWAAEMGTGKTLAAGEVLEESGFTDWLWVGPKSALRSAYEQFEYWQLKVVPKFMTYEGIVKLVEQWKPGQKAPRGIIFDESSRIKNPTAQRSQAAKHLADAVRSEWGADGYVILMSGSPAPKSPADWWHQCEVACPGFLREGTYEKFKQRLSLIAMRESISGGQYPHLITFFDDENKCAICGQLENVGPHDRMSALEGGDAHAFKKSVNEVINLYKRMVGLVVVKFKKDCLDLPEKVYKTISCAPKQSTINAAKVIASRAKNAAQALILLRELSDGFQYVEVTYDSEICPQCHGEQTIIEDYDPLRPGEAISQVAIDERRLQKRVAGCPTCDGTGELDKTKRDVKQVPCPKEDALKEILDEQEDVGRVVCYAGFMGSVDRCVSICQKSGWSTIRVDGRGWQGSPDLPQNEADLYKLFQRGKDQYPKVAFIGQPGAAGMGLTLTAASVIVYYSNDFNAESRIQSEDRIHRAGMDVNRGATIIDLVHLPTDQTVIDNLKKKRKLQDMTLGVLHEVITSAKVDDGRTF